MWSELIIGRSSSLWLELIIEKSFSK